MIEEPHGKFEFKGTIGLPEREREVMVPETIAEIITRLREEGVITPQTETEIIREITTELREREIIREVAAEVPPKPIPWGWIVAAGCLLVSGIICLSAKKDQGGKNA